MKSEFHCGPDLRSERLCRRFEHLGDTVLGLIVTNLLFDTYPNLRVGPSTVRPVSPRIASPPSLAVENPCPYCWQCHTGRYFSPISVAGTTQVAPRPGHHPQGQQQHTRQVRPFSTRYPTPLTCPPQPTSSRPVFSKCFIQALADDMHSLTWEGSISIRASPLSKTGSSCC
jgi:hypothetical protein